MNLSKSFAFSVALSCLATLAGCQRETEIPEYTKSDLHEVVFHAGWAEDDTRTVLQEDGSVWWAPGDEISLFVNDGQDGGYKLTATNTEPAAKVDFIGQIGGDLQGATFTAIYPYNEANRMDGNSVIFTIPTEQTAKEGTFGNGMLVSYAVSDNESLMFHNLCGGIKFSVAHEGIKKLVITSTGPNALAGEMSVWPDGPVCEVSGSNTITILAPNNVFEKEKYYYAVIAASEQNSWNGGEIQITYYTEDSAATTILPPVLFKRSVFKRLYEADKDLKFKRVYDSMALLPYEFLPEGVDKTTITEAYFHVSDPTTTETIISEGNSDYEPIYFEKNGTTVHFYTTGQAYKCYNVNFEGWKSLRSLDLSMFDVTDVQYMIRSFWDCHSLQSLNLSSFDTSDVSRFDDMFYNCLSLKEIDVSNFDTSNATSMSGMFAGCSNLTNLNVSSFDTHSVTTFENMFGGCSKLKQLDVSGFDTSSATDITAMFSGLTVESINVTHFNTSKVVNASALFSGCWNLRTLDVSSFDTSKMENMGAMFAGCRSLKSVDISTFDLSSVLYLSFLFQNCASLKDISMPSSSAPNLLMIHSMFEGCSSLEYIDLSSFDTSNVSMMIDMFMNCHSLRSLDLSSFNVKNVPSYRRMFYGCDNLEHLNISSFNPTTIADAEYTFYNTRKLTTLDLGEFDLSQSNNNDGAGHFLGELAKQCHIRCTPATKEALIAASPLLSDSKYIWYTDGSPLPDVDFENEEGLYCSSDYSKDKTVRTIQLASEGAGIDLVVMGDAYSDRLIANGKYDADMERAIDAIFDVEPFKSFKHLFNIYIVYAVSENEVIGKSTALSCFDSGPLGSEGWVWKSYYACAANVSSPGECSPVIILNSDRSDGTATGFQSSTTGDYMNDPLRDDYHGGVSESVAFISGPDDEKFGYTVRHEFGHSFGFLMDEYTNYSYAIPDWEISSWQFCFAYGMWKNVDLVSDDTIKWAKFINDPRYSGTGIGVYEGAFYETGAWRSTPESIMNSTDSGFNAPSREAIYYKIHKLAYGRNWEYNYEDFVTYDQPNIEADRARLSMPRHSIPSFKRRPFFEKTTVIGPDGKERIKITLK